MKGFLAGLFVFILAALVAGLWWFDYPPFNQAAPETDQVGTILYPAGGEVLTAGETYTLRWEDAGLGVTTEIFLIDTALESQGASVSVTDRKYDVQNNGTHQYTVPATTPAGTYVVSIGPLRSQPFTVTAAAGGESYSDSERGFSLTYPTGYTLDEAYVYDDLGPDAAIEGVRFTIPEAMATGTNLSADTYVAVEYLPDIACAAAPFVPPGTATSSVTDSGHTYSLATSSEGAAGNRYEELVYALPDTSPCLAVRYFIHSTVLENYPEGTVREFDRQALIDQFDLIRRSLTVKQ